MLLPGRNQYVVGINLKIKTLISVIFVINYSKDNNLHSLYGGADKSLAQPGRKQARAREDFDFRISYL